MNGGGIQPDHVLLLQYNTGLGESLLISQITLCSLSILAMEDTCDLAVSSANQLLNCGDLPDYKPTKLNQVCATLQDVFQSADEILCQQIYDFFLENSISKRTVDEAKKKLGIQSAKRGNAWYWLRPQQNKEDCNIVCL